MQTDKSMNNGMSSRELINALIRFGLIAYLVSLCLKIVSPFSSLILWGMTLAVMLYPLHQLIAGWLRGKQGRAAAIIFVVGFLLLGVPSWLVGDSLIGHVKGLHTAIEKDELTIPKPGPKVAEWPVIGERTFKAWSKAANDYPEFAHDYGDEIKRISKWSVSKVGSIIGSMAMFLGSLAIAALMMTWGKPATQSIERILTRIVGPVKGPEIQTISVKTVRSVATGVLGVAIIQALLFGIGFLLTGVQAAGILAAVVLLIGIMQLPALIVAIPVIILMWMKADGSTVMNIVFTVYFLIAGMADNILKPLLLGRGVSTPMPVILIGALGGMVVGGFIGLFLGAVFLAVGYEVFMDWVNDGAVGCDGKPEAKALAGE